MGVDQKNVKVMTNMSRVELDEMFKDAKKRFRRETGKGGRPLLFIYCGGYGIVDTEHYYLLNDDYRFIYSIETFLRSLSKFAVIVSFYDLVRQPIGTF